MSHRTTSARRGPRLLPRLAPLTLMLTTPAIAQLTPDRLYYGIDRPIPMTVAQPEGTTGQLSIKLLNGADASVVESADVPEGRVDLAGLFPSLWTAKPARFLRAQLYVGEAKHGPSVVLQPLITPDYARLIDLSTGEPTLPPVMRDAVNRDVRFTDQLVDLRRSKNLLGPMPYQAVYSGIRAYVDKNVVFETTEGTIEFRLRPEFAPNTCWNFRQLAAGGWYTDIPFHRIIPGFVIQGGDPTGVGSGGPGFMIDLEPSTLKHDFGILSMARSADPNSNGSQFFVCLSRESTQGLDGRYTSFGEAVSGADAIMAIASTPLSDPDLGTPKEAPRIISAHLTDATPYGEGPPRAAKPQMETTDR